MATFGPQFGENDQGTLSLETKEPGLVEVYFRPSNTRLRIARRESDPKAQVLLLRFDGRNQTTTLFPVNTMPNSTQFLEPKHRRIVSIELVEKNSFFSNDEGDFYVPKTSEDVQGYLDEGMPSGFTKDPNYGLGLDRKLAFIIDALDRVDGVAHLRLTDQRSLDVALSTDGKTYEMGFELFDILRRDANRFDARAQVASRKKKSQLGYTSILTNLDAVRFPVKVLARAPDDVADAIGSAIVDARLSERDRTAVVGLAEASVRSTLKTQPNALVKLHDEIELASLDELIAQMETRLAVKTTEPQWQKLFETNPFILDLAFNVPVLLLQGQAHVGGKKLNGTGGKITDFLFANQLTDNMVVLEIKTPGTVLLSRKEYRGGVFGPSSEFVAAITQVLDQVNKLQSDIYRLKADNPQHGLESHGIRGVLVAGMIPDNERKRSFELYRSALAGVSVITFDEVLAKLKSLRTLLGTRRA